MKRPLLFATLLTCLFLTALSVNAQFTTNYRLGYEAYENEDYDTALRYFERDLAANPKNGLTLLMCAAIYSNYNDYTRSLQAVNAAIKNIDKNDKQTMAWAYTMRGYAQCMLGDTVQALKDYDKSLKFVSPNSYLAKEKIKIFIAQDNWAQAYKTCDQLIASDPSNEEVYMYYAVVYMLDGKPEQAIEKITNAIQINPRNPKNYVYRADQFCKLKNYSRAADDVEQYFALGGDGSDVEDLDLTIRDCPAIVTKLQGVINRDPKNIGAVYMLTTLQQRDDQYLAAARVLGKSFLEVPLLSTAFYIARDLNHLGYNDLASDWCNYYIANDTTQDVYPLVLSADIAHDRGDYDTALSTISNYIYTTHEAYGYYYRAWLYRELNRHDDACADFTTCIGLEPDLAYAYLGRAKQYLKLGDHEKARADFRRIIELEDTLTEPTCLQYAYHYLGNDQRATEIMQRLLTASPDAGNYYDAACLYTLMGQPNEALGYLETALAKGFRDFNHIQADDDLDALRSTDRYKSIISHYKQVFAQEQQEAQSYPELIPPTYLPDTVEVEDVALRGGGLQAAEEVAADETYAPLGSNSTAIAIASTDYEGDRKGGITIDDLKENSSASDESEEVVDNAIVEVQATYPGGEAALLKFVHENLVYPASAAKQGIEGVVTLRFRVEKDGSVGEIRIVKSLTPDCDRAAANVVKKLARFKPALKQSKPYPVWFTLPVRFRLP